MNPFAAAAQIVGNVLDVTQRFAFFTDPDYLQGEYLASVVTCMAGGAGAAAITLTELRLGKTLLRQSVIREMMSRGISRQEATSLTATSDEWADESARERATNEAKGGNIIAITMAIVDALEQLTGWGPPDEGASLGAGSQQLTALAGLLGLAAPDDDWQGEGSRAYADENTAVRELALALAELDTQLAAVVTSQATWAAHIRLGFGILTDLLAAALVVELTLRCSGHIKAAVVFAITVCVLAILAATTLLAALTTSSNIHAGQADALNTQYGNAAIGADVWNAVESTPSAAVMPSTVESVKVLPKTLSAVGGGGEAYARRHAQTGGGQAPEVGGPVPVVSPPDTAVVAMPFLAQLRACSGAPRPEPAIAGPVGQMADQSTRLNGSGRPGHSEVSAEPDRTDDAAGAEAGERVPLTAVGAQPLPQSAMAGQS